MSKCPKCRSGPFDVVDRNGIYSESCWNCGYNYEISKSKYDSSFKCKKCGTTAKYTIDNDVVFAFRCLNCGREEVIVRKRELGFAEIKLRELDRQGKSLYTEEETRLLLQPSKVPEEPTYQREPSLVRCPKCNSKQISTGQRGYSIIWKWSGSNRTMNRCANCGYKWMPRR